MKKWLALAVALAALAAPALAAAHPLGNFTINRSSELHIAGDRLYVHYVLDLAEIPTFQLRRSGRIDAERLAARLGRGLEVKVDGTTASVRPLRRRLSNPAGAGGLPTTRLEVVYGGPTLDGEARLAFRDRNYAGRLGWKEVVVSAAAGAELVRSNVPDASGTDHLRRYPSDRLSSPLDVTTARAVVRAGPAGAEPPALGEEGAKTRAASGFESLVERGDLSLLVVLASLGIALFWGATHALGPGHGKSIVAAYLIGQRGSVRHAFCLGGIVTVTHTIGVFALGLVTLLLSELVVPEDLYPWLNLAAGLMVLAVGLAVLRGRLGHRLAHALGHHHHHDHTHAPPERLSPRSLIAVGVSGGILPCPSALVVLLAAISLHRVGFGMLLVLAFSIGLALTITGIGLVAVLAKRAFGRLRLDGRLVRLLPVLSATAIVLVGAVMTVRALPEVSL